MGKATDFRAGATNKVVHNCPRFVAYSPILHLSSKTDIYIFIVRKIVFIKEANSIEHFGPVQTRATTSGKDFSL
jgi:hypothetical protein